MDASVKIPGSIHVCLNKINVSRKLGTYHFFVTRFSITFWTFTIVENWDVIIYAAFSASTKALLILDFAALRSSISFVKVLEPDAGA